MCSWCDTYPFAVHLIIPIVWFGGFWVWNGWFDIIPAVWFHIFWVSNGGLSTKRTTSKKIPLKFSIQSTLWLYDANTNRHCNTYIIFPVFWFCGSRILDFLWCQDFPVIFQATRFNLFVIDQYFVGVVWLNDQCVVMGEHIILAPDILFDQMILALVVEDDVDAFGAWSANVWTEHHQVWRITVQILLFDGAVEDFQVAAAAVDVLFVFNGELQD